MRAQRVSLRLSEVESASLLAKADTAGLTLSGYLAQLALATVEMEQPPVSDPRRVLLAGVLKVSAEFSHLAGPLLRATDGGDVETSRRTAESVRVALDRLDELTVALLRSVR